MNKEGDDYDRDNFSIYHYNEQLKATDDYFDYRLKQNGSNEITGIMWMTGQMRADFDKYGSRLNFDMMKKLMNTHLLLYFAIVMNRPDGTIAIAIEGLVVMEDVEQYKFGSQALGEMAHKRTLDDVYVVSADGFLDQKKEINLGFKNARYVYDQFHLIQVNIADAFKGTGHFQKLAKFIYQLFNSQSENDFELTFGMILKQMRLLNCDTNQLQYVMLLKERRKEFAHYELRKLKGTVGRKGNASSESNHASVLSNLGRNYCESPIRMETDLLHRQRLWSWKRVLAHNSENLVLITENQSAQYEALQHACSNRDGYSLVLAGYRIFKNEVTKSHQMVFDENIEIEDGVFKMFDPFVGESYTVSKDIPCTCPVAVADMCGCCHKFAVEKRYNPCLFDTRYIYESSPNKNRKKRNDISLDTTKLQVDEIGIVNDDEECTFVPKEYEGRANNIRHEHNGNSLLTNHEHDLSTEAN